MNENTKKWIAALRSDDFKQTTSCLRDFDGHCCLGVACEVYRREAGEGHWNKEYTQFRTEYIFMTAEGKYTACLPPIVAKWLGLRSTSGHNKNTLTTLAVMNDEGFSFEEIANALESDIDGFFTEPESSDP